MPLNLRLIEWANIAARDEIYPELQRQIGALAEVDLVFFCVIENKSRQHLDNFRNARVACFSPEIVSIREQLMQ